eukprot:Em0004g1006a
MAEWIIIQRNIERLISRCESIIDGKLSPYGKEWKLGKYLVALREQTLSLEKYSSVEPDLLSSFKQRVEVLQQIRSEDAKPLLKPSEARTPLKGSVAGTPQRLQPCAGGDELVLKMHSKQGTLLKERLFAKSGSSDVSATSSRASVGSVLETHQKMQEEIAEDMVRMARSLRSNSLLVRDIIQKDSKVLTKTNELADDNIEGIDRNVAKLKQNNSQCSWWIWIMLAVVFVVFFAMVLFIRVMPKPH